MERHDACYRQYVQILREELRPATGCTEPIAIAYAAAKARSVLGALPDRVLVEVSGNIIKNVKSVVVPHTGGLRGIPAVCGIRPAGRSGTAGAGDLRGLRQSHRPQLPDGGGHRGLCRLSFHGGRGGGAGAADPV